MTERAEILLVEDYEPDARLIALLLQRNGVTNKLHIVRDAVEALDFILERGEPKNQSAKCCLGVVLVDIHLPKMDGWDVLRQIKQNAPTRDIAVIMLSGHVFPEDEQQAGELGALGCLVKPVAFDKLRDLLSDAGISLIITRPGAPAKR